MAAHDTACAFAASPLAATGRAFVSAGTWFLVGVERAAPDVSEEARLANFSNERGALGGLPLPEERPRLLATRAVRGAVGDERRRSARRAAGAPSNAPRFDVTDEQFLAPARMADAVRAAAGLTDDAPRALIARSVVESLAAAVAGVVDQLRATQPVEELVVVGGGAASPFVRERIAEHAAARVVAGSTEATALGNALVQGIALERFRDLDDARSWASTSSAAR